MAYVKIFEDKKQKSNHGFKVHFLTDFEEYLANKYKELPRLWIKLATHITVSSVIGRKVYCKTNIGRNLCNLWILLIGDSGTYKSSLMDNTVIPIIREVGRRLNKRFILPSIASTVEGIIDVAKDNPLEGLIFKDEFTTMFNLRKYEASWEIYSKMYDGWIPPRATMKVRIHSMIPVYVNMMGATTPKYLFDVLNQHSNPQAFYEQGFGCRLEIVYNQKEIRNDYKVEDMFPKEEDCFEEIYKMKEDKIDEELIPFVDQLTEIAEWANKGTVYISILDSAKKAWIDFHNERRTNMKNITSDRHQYKKSFYARTSQKALKHAQVITIANMFKKGNVKEPIITKKIMDEAIRIAELCEENFEELMKNFGYKKPDRFTQERDDLPVVQDYLRTIKNFTKTYGAISQKRLSVEVGSMRNKDFYMILSWLITSGCIEVIKDNNDSNDPQKRKKSTNFCRVKTEKWKKEMIISENFKTAPVLYKFLHDIPENTKVKYKDGEKSEAS